MEVIIGGRQAGKTREAVKLWQRHDYDGILVVIDYKERARIIAQYFIPEEFRDRIMTSESYAWERKRLNKLYIDNADMILARLFRGTPEVITTSGQATILHGGR